LFCQHKLPSPITFDAARLHYLGDPNVPRKDGKEGIARAKCEHSLRLRQAYYARDKRGRAEMRLWGVTVVRKEQLRCAVWTAAGCYGH